MWRRAIAWTSLVLGVVGIFLDAAFVAFVWAQPATAKSPAPVWAKLLVAFILLAFLVSGPAMNIVTALFGRPIISPRQDSAWVADTFS